jgi:hypothetical protein
VSAYRRRAGVSETAVDAELYLVAPGSDDIFHLDPIAAGIWRMLEEPANLTVLQDTLSDAFPDAVPGRIAGDVTAALATLRLQGLVEEVVA